MEAVRVELNNLCQVEYKLGRTSTVTVRDDGS